MSDTESGSTNVPWQDREPIPGLVRGLPGIAYQRELDAPGTLRFLNGRGCREILARPPDEIFASETSFFDFVHPEDRERVREASVRAAEAGRPYDLEYRLVTGDGRTVWVVDRGHPVREASSGSLRGVEGFLLDISDRMERTLVDRGIRDILEGIARNVPVTSSLHDLVRLVEKKDPEALCSVLLREGDRLRVLAAPRLSETFRAASDGLPIGPDSGTCGRAAHLGRTVVTRDVREDPNWEGARDVVLGEGLVACWSEPIVSPDGEVLGTFATYFRSPREPGEPEKEILRSAAHIAALAVEHHRTVRDLRESEARYRLLAEHASDVISIHDGEGRIRYISPAARAVLGRAPEDLRGRNAFDLIHPDDGARVRTVLAQALEGEPVQPVSFRVEVPAPDGREWRWVESGGRLLGRNGRSRVVVITRDITERRLLERQAVRAERLEAVGRLAGGVAHDFNNLLTVMKGEVELLRLGYSDGIDGAMWDDLTQLEGAVDRAASLVDQLLQFSRRRRIDPEPVVVGEFLETRRADLEKIVGGGIRLTVDDRTEGATVPADAGQLEEIVMNVVVNAVEATSSGGRVAIRADVVRLPDDADAVTGETASSLDPGDYVLLRVEDSGEGMSSDVLDRIFEPFFTTRGTEGGSGLGLSVAYGLAERHGGTIAARSDPGEGTAIEIVLPRMSRASRPAHAGRAGDDGPTPGSAP